MTEISEVSTTIVSIIRAKAESLPPAAVRELSARCPRCSSALCQNDRAYECAACDFRLLSEVARRRLSNSKIDILLRSGRTDVLSGFTSRRTGKKFSAALCVNIETGKIEFVFEDKAPTEAEGATRLKATCPQCKVSIKARDKAYACTTCDFKVWSEIASRKLSAPEAEILIGKGSTGLLAGFKSSAGRKFSAKLKLHADTRKVDFEFEPHKKEATCHMHASMVPPLPAKLPGWHWDMALLFALAGYNRQHRTTSPDNARREAIQGFQTIFYRVSEGKARWIEMAISVEGSKTFRMPVFFVHNGQFVQVEDKEARALINKWIRNRVENVAAFGSVDPQAGVNGPFLAIDRNSQ